MLLIDIELKKRLVLLFLLLRQPIRVVESSALLLANVGTKDSKRVDLVLAACHVKDSRLHGKVQTIVHVLLEKGFRGRSIPMRAPFGRQLHGRIDSTIVRKCSTVDDSILLFVFDCLLQVLEVRFEVVFKVDLVLGPHSEDGSGHHRSSDNPIKDVMVEQPLGLAVSPRGDGPSSGWRLLLCFFR